MTDNGRFQEFIARYPLLGTIGNTPVIRVDLPAGFSLAGHPNVASDKLRVFAKLENLNAGGSIKDRPVLRMMVEAVLAGDLPESKTLIDSTSGNAGIAYAMIGAVIGRKVELVMPGNASEERKKRVLAHGATIVETDPLLGYDEAMREVRRRYEGNPDKYFFCNQYANDNNWLAHYDTTAVEILSQVPDITHFVAGVGTGGTVTGVGRRLKKHNPAIKVISIEPGDWRGIEGLKPLNEDNLVPEILDQSVIDERVPVGLDEAFEMAKVIASKGIFVGQSSGAYLVAAVAATAGAVEAGEDATVVTIFNDLGERYFSTGMWG